MPTSCRCRSRRSAVALLALAGLACAASNPWALTPSPARDLPPRFVADTATAPGAARLPAANTCLVHLTDPRDGTRLTLARSTGTGAPSQLIGDYAVAPAGRYGVGPSRLLRVDCRTGQGRGVVDAGG